MVFEAENIEKQQVRIINRFVFSNLNQYEIRWQLSENGKTLQSGSLSPQNIEAGASAAVTIPFKGVKFNENAEYWLTLSLNENADRLWCSKGFEVAHEQLLVKSRNNPEAYA